MRSRYILGLHVGHDGTASLLNPDGTVAAAIAEERLSRVKYHMGFPYRSVEEVIRIAGITKQDIDTVVFTTKRQVFPGNDEYNDLFFTEDMNVIRSNDIFNKPNLKSPWSLVFDILFNRNKHSEIKDFKKASEELTLKMSKDVLDRIGLGHCEVKTMDHHLCHAASAYYCSGKKEALIVTMDGAGDGLCASINVIENGQIKRVSGASDLVSPGRFYSEVTGFVGFKRLRHEGKITGLAAYGDSDKFYKELKQFIRFNKDTEQFEYDHLKFKKSPIQSKIKTIKRIFANRSSALPHTNDFFDYLEENFHPKDDMMHLAAAAQRILEEIAVEYVSHFLNKFPNKNVLMAGGIFANVRVNQLIAELPGVEFIYIHQNMGDGGNSLGGAMLEFHKDKGNALYQPNNVYYGPGYTNEEIEADLKKNGIEYSKEENIEKLIAELIHKGKVVGRFNGRMEYGPRALGNRTIIAAPTDKTINDWLNEKLNRTEFMPFAPAVLPEMANEVLVNYSNHFSSYAANFMTVTYHVVPEWAEKTQATTHVDGTARPQLVTSEANPSFNKVIKEYFEISGIPAVINTSFNMHEEPIVTTPDDAIRSFKQGCLDYLAIGDFLCKYE